MATLGDDCYFFCTSTCVKGPACPFRHVEAAKTCKVICQHWQLGGCFRPHCKFRHSDFPLQLDTSEVQCFWETQPTGCTKRNCPYKHLNPRPENAVPSGGKPAVTSANGAPATTSGQAFVSPMVKQMVIDPLAESEESNASPVKRQPQAINPSLSVTNTKPENKPVQQSGSAKAEENKSQVERSKEEEKKVAEPVEEKTVPKKTKKVIKKVKGVKAKTGNVIKKTKKAVSAEGERKTKAPVAPKLKKKPVQPRKSVKERLGTTQPKVADISRSSDGESGSDSDDSIENVKVLSMEEIFRQKALESMMKKRAAEGKPVPKTISKSAPARVGVKTIPKKKQPVPVPAKESSSSSSKESSSSSEEEEEENEEKAQESSSSSSSSSDSSSSSESEDDSDDSGQFEEPDVRRVVVDVESEKSARKRAKESLKKRKLSTSNALNKPKKGRVLPASARLGGKTLGTPGQAKKKVKDLKKRVVDVDYDSDDIVSCRVKEPLTLNVNVRDRLGKPLTLAKRKTSDGSLISRAEKFGTVRGVTKDKSGDSPRKTVLKRYGSSSSEDDHDPLTEVKVKTLEEIKQEKLRKQAAHERLTGSPQRSSIKQRLDLTTVSKQVKEEEEDDGEARGRQVLIVNDTGSKSDESSNTKTSEEQKKAKRRPWRTMKRTVDQSVIGDDQRTAVVSKATVLKLVPSARGDDYESELNSYKEEQEDIPESPFERMKRRALMKKMQGTEGRKVTSDLMSVLDRKNKSEESFETVGEQVKDETAEENAGSKKHKHKHKHKSKKERQIYMPPAMKSSSSVANITVKKSISPEKSLSATEPTIAPTAKVMPQKRGRHPIAAAWAAGLTLSSKGTVGNRPGLVERPVITEVPVKERIGLGTRIGVKPSEPETKAKVAPIQTPQPPTDSAGVTIKSFSEIMAEKRKRRLEMQSQKADSTTVSSSSGPSASTSVSSISSFPAGPSQASETKPRAPITPIVFKPDPSSNGAAKTSRHPAFASIEKSKSHQPVPVTVEPTSVLSKLPSSTTFPPTSNLDSTDNSSEKMTPQPAKKNVATIPSEKKKKNTKKLFTRKKSSDKILSQTDSLDMSDSNLSQPSISKTATTLPASSTVPAQSQTRFPVSSTGLSQTFNQVPSHPAQNPAAGIGSIDSGYEHTISNIPSRNIKHATSVNPTVAATSLKSPTSGTGTEGISTKHKIQTTGVESEPSKKKKRSSMDDEFSFFDDTDIGGDDDVVTGEFEPIDDLLQDIDDLLN